MLTTQEIFKEYARCLTQPTYAIETYLETFDKTQEGFVPFRLFPRQREIITAYEKNRFNIVTKPRQAGVSTTTAAYMSVKVGFADSDNPENILIIANKQELAFEFLAKIKDFLNQLPRWVWGHEYYGNPKNESKSIFLTDSKKEIKLPNGSRVKAVATSKDALRGFTPTFLIMDEAAYIDNGAEVFGAALTALGCLTKDSLILTENGLVELDELVIEKDKLGFTDLDVPHMVCNKDGVLTPATQTFVSEYGETFKIKTKLGIELEGSWKHPLLINRNGEEVWVRMNELVVGDKPIINYNQNYFGQDSKFDFSFDRVNYNQKNINIPVKLSDNLDFCYLLGLFVAEGNFTSRGITITNVDEQITNFLINDIAKLGNGFKKVDDRHYNYHSTELVQWFEEFGLKKHNARDKEIPLSILKMPKEVIVNFLQGMFDGDGMSTIKDIKYSSTSKKLIKTLQTLLLNFGIISHIKKETQKTSESSIIPNKDHVCTIYNLKIYSEHAIKFYDEIGFRLDRKQKNRQYLIGKKLNSRFISVSQETILKILKKNGVTKSKFRFLERFWGSKYERLSYESLNRLILNLPNDEELLFLSEQIKYNNKYYIDEIIEITNSEDYTYDLHVPETNSFISNGVVSHNTGGRATLISCVTKDTFVFTNEGVKEVSEFIDESKGDNPNLGYNIQDYSIQGLFKTRTSNLFVNNGLQETIKLESTSGSIEGTHTHKLWCYSKIENKFDWYEMSQLNEGDYINIQSGFELWGNYDEIGFEYKESNKEHNIPNDKFNKITTDLAYLIGLYISEGSVYKTIDKNNNHIGTSITITCGDDVSEAITNCGFKYSSHDNLHYTIGSKYLGGLLEHLGFDLTKKANEKIIPSRLLKMSRENIIAMLQGIMDGDGYSDSVRGRIGINMSSKRLVEQIRMLFLNFGILTDYNEGVTPITKKVKVTSNFYRISAISNNAKKYYDLIGFRFKRKQNKSLSLPIFNNDNQSEFIPNGKRIIREIIDDFNLVRKLSGTGLKVNDLHLSLKNKTYDLNKNKFIKFINYFENVLLLDLGQYNIDKILLLNGKWEKIKNISHSKNKTYDFSLPNDETDFWCHSVIYNGILGHQTPNGMDSLYYKTYDQAKNKKNNFNIVEMKWYEDLRYNKDLSWLKDDQVEREYEFTFESYTKKIEDGWKPTSTWYEQMCMGMNNDAKMIAQELDVSFIGSGGNVINEEYIEFHEKNNVKEPKYTAGLEQEIWVWEEPKEGHQYIAGIDVSRGDGEDSSTIVIVDFTTMEQVMEYQGKIQPDLLAQIVEEYGNLYKAYSVVDVTGGMGVSTVLKLLEFEYKHLHYDDTNGKILSARQRELTSYNKQNKIPGFHATNVRLPMISNLEYKIRTNGIKIRSSRLISEMKTFIYKNGRPDHMEGYHDDLIMSLGMALWVMEHSFKNLERLEKQTKAILSSWLSTSNPSSTVTTINPETKQIEKKINPNHSAYKNVQDPRGEYSWLFGKR
jgi:intein/homing endonuclease